LKSGLRVGESARTIVGLLLNWTGGSLPLTLAARFGFFIHQFGTPWIDCENK
jgi:hypothetical protein